MKVSDLAVDTTYTNNPEKPVVQRRIVRFYDEIGFIDSRWVEFEIVESNIRNGITAKGRTGQSTRSAFARWARGVVPRVA